MKIKLNKKTVIISAIALVLIAAIVVSLFIFLGAKDFRKTSWGMSWDKVKKVESAEIIREMDDKLVYKIDNIEGVKAESFLNYNFAYNSENSRYELWQANMGVEVIGFDGVLAKKIIRAFEDKYGEPDEYVETITKHDHFWKTERTEIHVEQLENYILIEYTDITYAID